MTTPTSPQQDLPKRTSRLRKEDWVGAATSALRRGGVDAVAVEQLAAGLNVTRGSFYAHFDSRDELLRAVLERWRSSELAALQEPEHGDGHQRLTRRLRQMFSDRSAGEIHAQLCAAAEDPIVGPVHLENLLATMASLADLYRAAGLRRAAAEQRALVTYTAYIGFWRAVTALPNIEGADALGASLDMFDGYPDALIPLLLPPATADTGAAGAAGAAGARKRRSPTRPSTP